MRRQAAFATAAIAVLMSSAGAYASPRLIGIHKIQHIVVIMQENRSFDSYFGTYPGADGIPMRHGVPTVCLPAPLRGHCLRPYHDSRAVNLGGPHEAIAFKTDFNNGRMDGFIRARQSPQNSLPNLLVPLSVRS